MSSYSMSDSAFDADLVVRVLKLLMKMRSRNFRLAGVLCGRISPKSSQDYDAISR